MLSVMSVHKDIKAKDHIASDLLIRILFSHSNISLLKLDNSDGENYSSRGGKKSSENGSAVKIRSLFVEF